ncbi:MAG: tRNA (adenosine(37)-N6)-threonylcarbamoyltransferase complex ATPase subunit type 1 TsaE [Clostridia bacterium]|nr:tRNA (adenosine(37)-N6)-threonylcarbamoyltransferase complex ATPase subunit type 1 TsaE [Clostridia bacterium]MBO7737074.1 tRNA (adenosine(37)-N6)-threonylcarbamoyltransferase complex ATPase subunit type 1 TsaE [Clostridia bacterium]
MKEYISNSPAETEEIAYRIAKDLCPGDFVAFFGDLGAGKTAFSRGIVKCLAPECLELVHSPTFAIVNEYVGEKISIFHFDMYRIKDEDDLVSTGFYDYEERGGIILTEWSENIPFAIPENAVRVNIEKISETARRFTIC